LQQVPGLQPERLTLVLLEQLPLSLQLVQQPGRAVLALQADHHRLDGHQLRQGGRQVLQGVRLVDMCECLAHAPMPFVQRPEGHCDQCVVVWFAHAPQSSG